MSKTKDEIRMQATVSRYIGRSVDDTCQHHQRNYFRQWERALAGMEKYEEANDLKAYRFEVLGDDGLHQDDGSDIGVLDLESGKVRYNCNECKSLMLLAEGLRSKPTTLLG